MAGPLTEAEELELLELELEEAQLKARTAQPGIAANQNILPGMGGGEMGVPGRVGYQPNELATGMESGRILTQAQQALQAQADAERKAREAPVRTAANEAGRTATMEGLSNTPAWAMGLGGPSATLMGQAASEGVYDEAGIVSPSAALEMRGLNSALFGVPGLVNEGVRERIGQAGQDQPGASMLGDVAGYLVPGEAAWQAGKAATNAFARPIVSRIMPQGGSAIERGTRFAGRYGTQSGAWAGQNALYQGTVGESVAAAEEGRTPSIASAAERAGEGATDPLNALGPAALMGLNRLREFAATGGRSATPRSVAESVAANRGAPTGGSFLDAGRLGGGDVDRRAETLLVRMLRNAGYSGDDIRRGLATFDTLAEQTSDLPVLASRLKDVLIDQLGPRAEQVVQDFLQGAGVSRGGTAGQAVADAAQQDYGRLSDFLEASANARLGQGSRFDTLTAAQDEMTRIGNEGYERVFGAAPTNQEGVADLRQALDFYANSELATPLRQVAAGRMLNVEQMIEADPRRAAHWMQHTAGLRAQEAADAGNEVLARAYTDMRQQILRRLEADGVAPGYQQARMQFGDQFGIEQAVNFGSRFFTRVQDSVGVRQLAEDIRNLTPQQQEAALLSIRDELLRIAGRGREGAAPRLSQLNTESALGGLETVVGERGGQLANDIRFIDERLARIRRTDPTANSRTATNTEAREFADRAVSNPITRTIGNAINAIGGDAALASVASGGTVPPVFSIRAGMRAMGDRMARGRQGKIDDVTALLLRDYGGVPRPGMPGDAMPPLTSRSGPTSGGAPQVENAFAQTMSNQQTVPSQNAFTRSQGLPQLQNDALSGGLYGGVGAFSGNFVDYNGDGVNDEQDMAIGAGIGAGGGALASRVGSKVSLPKGKGSRWDAEDVVSFADRVIADTKPKPITRVATEDDLDDAITEAVDMFRQFQTSKGKRFDFQDAPSPRTAGPDDKPMMLVEEMAAQILRSRGIDPDPVLAPRVADRFTNAESERFNKALKYTKNQAISKEQMTEEYGSEIANSELMKPPRLNGVGNAFAQSVMGGAGGSAYGSQNDINGDGVIDEQDVFLGSAAGTVGAPVASALMRRGGNAFARGAKPQGAGAPKTPQQAMRAELPGSPEYEAAVAKGLDMSTPARMQRAREMGFDTETVLYHGTGADIDAFNLSGDGANGPGIYFALDPDAASAYANRRGERANVLPVFLKSGKYATTQQLDDLAKSLRANDSPQALDRSYASAVERLKAEGFIGVRDNKFVSIFDPSNIRSVHAAFDPDKAASPILTAGLGGGGRKPPPDSPEAITDAVRGIAKQAPPTPPGGPVIPPRGNMRGVLQAPERIPPASPMADQVPPPLPPRPVSNRVPTSNMPNATEMGLMAGTGAAIGGAFLMEKANDPATFGLASFDQLPPDHPLRDPNYRRMALMAQMQPQQSQNAFASARQ